MSGVAVLAGRMGALTERRVELRMRMVEKARLHFMGSTILDWLNQIVEVSEEIGTLKERLQAQVKEGNPADPGVPVDLRMASGVRVCVECHEVRSLDENGRCGVCQMMVADGRA